MNSADAIRHYCNLGFELDTEMSVMASIAELEAEHLSAKCTDETWSVEEILYHTGLCKMDYCRQGFALAAPNWEWPKGDAPAILDALRAAQAHMVACLDACSDDDLTKPIPTNCHGESAAHFF